jgi:hypothetical protein
MSLQKDSKIDKKKYAFTVRMDQNMHEIVEYLKQKKLQSKAGIIRLAVSELYEKEKGRDNYD